MLLIEWAIDQELNISLGEAKASENVSPKGLNQCELDHLETVLPKWIYSLTWIVRLPI